MKLDNHLLCGAAAFALATCIATAASAATLSIQFTGLNLSYSGSTLNDAASAANGNGDSTEADPLTTAVFSVDGTTVGTLTSDIFADVSIPGISGLSTTGSSTTSASAGTFDFLTSTSVPGYGLEINVSSSEVIYLPVSGVANFLFGGSLGNSGAQNLPFGLVIGDDVEITFSAQVINATSAGGVLTTFDAAGTGGITGPVVPEPASFALAGLGICGLSLLTRRRS